MVLEPSILDCEVGICHQCEGGELAMMTNISTTNHHSILHWKYALSAHKHFMKKLLLDMFGSADVDMWYVSTISRYLPHVSRLCVFSASAMIGTFRDILIRIKCKANESDNQCLYPLFSYILRRDRESVKNYLANLSVKGVPPHPLIKGPLTDTPPPLTESPLAFPTKEAI